MQCVFQGRKELSFRSEVTDSRRLGAALRLAWILNQLQNWPAVSMDGGSDNLEEREQ